MSFIDKLSFSYSEIIMVLMVVSLGFMSFVPNPFDLASVFFVVFFVSAFFVSLAQLVNGRAFPVIGLYFIFFLLSVSLVAVPLGWYNGRGVYELLRAVAPFLFIVSFFIFSALKHGREMILLKALYLASIVWMFDIYLFHYGAIFSYLSGDVSRLTLLVSDLLVPFSLIGFCFSLFNKEAPRAARAFLSLMFLFLIYSSGYRSQWMLVFFIVFCFVFMRVKYRGVLYISLFFMAVLSFVFGALYYDLLLGFFSRPAGDAVRLRELQFGLSEFISSPLLGKGLANPVPVIFTRGGLDHIDKDFVPYVHNIFAYFAMNMGSLGLFYVISLYAYASYLLFFVLRRGGRELQGIVVALFSILLMFLISASYRQIQMNVAVALLVFVAYRMKRRYLAETLGSAR